MGGVVEAHRDLQEIVEVVEGIGLEHASGLTEEPSDGIVGGDCRGVSGRGVGASRGAPPAIPEDQAAAAADAMHCPQDAVTVAWCETLEIASDHLYRRVLGKVLQVVTDGEIQLIAHRHHISGLQPRHPIEP